MDAQEAATLNAESLAKAYYSKGIIARNIGVRPDRLERVISANLRNRK